MKKISQYSFVDSSIVNVLFLDNVISSSYDEGMVDLLLENMENKSIVESVLSYFLEKSRMLNLFSDKTKLGYNPETNVYYFGTDSQLALNNAKELVDVTPINPSRALNSPNEKPKGRKRGFIGLTALLVLVGSTVAFSISPVGEDIRSSILTSVFDSPSNSEVKTKVSKENIDSIRSNILSLNNDNLSEERLSSIYTSIESLGNDSGKGELYSLLTTRQVDLRVYKEVSSQLSAYPINEYDYFYLGKAIDSISSYSQDLKDSLYEQERQAKDYIISMGYTVE